MRLSVSSLKGSPKVGTPFSPFDIFRAAQNLKFNPRMQNGLHVMGADVCQQARSGGIENQTCVRRSYYYYSRDDECSVLTGCTRCAF
jgi:hypothetical protein